MSAVRGPVIRQSLLTLLICIAVSLPLYLLAVWSYATAFWQTADSNMKGWMFFLFPTLMIPPFVPWLKIAIPASLGFALPHPVAKVFVLVGAFAYTMTADVTGLDRQSQSFEQEVPAIGNIPPVLFKLGIWLLIGVGALIARSAFAKRDTPLEVKTDA